MGEVLGFDLTRKMVQLPDLEIPYDYLVVAAGAQHSYFGHDEWEPFAPGLKTVEDALEIRRRVLLAFELAEKQAVSDGEQPMLTFAIVGGGPTGVELAGTLAEIANKVLQHEFRSIDPKHTRIVTSGRRAPHFAFLRTRPFSKRSSSIAASWRGCARACHGYQNRSRSRLGRDLTGFPLR